GRDRPVSTRYSGPVRAVLGVRGEPGQPDDPAHGLVWSAIVDQIDRPGSESTWVSVVERPRADLAQHPWSLSGGGAGETLEHIERAAPTTLAAIAESVGIVSFTLEDDLYVQPERVLGRYAIPESFVRPIVLGDGVRDWTLTV